MLNNNRFPNKTFVNLSFETCVRHGRSDRDESFAWNRNNTRSPYALKPFLNDSN